MDSEMFRKCVAKRANSLFVEEVGRGTAGEDMIGRITSSLSEEVGSGLSDYLVQVERALGATEEISR